MSGVQRVNVPGVARLPSFSHATIADRHVYVSGLLGTAGEDLALVPGGLLAETRQALSNLRQVLQGCGCGLADVAKVNLYLTDVDRFREVNDVYDDFFASDPPARITLGVHRLAIGASVEVDCLAQLPGAS